MTGRVVLRDGTALRLTEGGAAEAGVTVVFLHGWTLDSRTWRHQLADLPGRCPRPVRLVAYDHRGHGGSDPVRLEHATVAQVADDLAEVLARVVPAGPVVLAGHSLGGMAVLALAERHPEVFDARVAAAALVATSAGGLAAVTLRLAALVATC